MFDFIKKRNHNFSNRDMLFGDLPLSYWGAVNCKDVPWSLFKEVKKSVEKGRKNKAISILTEIINMPGLESRQYLQAYHFLNELQESDGTDIKILGVVVEVSMPQGNDTLAVYADHSARYYNFSGKSIIWEHPDESIDAMIDSILTKSVNTVAQIGPWKDVRPNPPGKEMARINFLTSHGLHFGEASQQVLFNDPLAGAIMYDMVKLMNTLIDKSTHQSSSVS
ncbi:MAG: hypothetical protein ABIN94_01530 [Ferruginibacter sp.]